MFAARSSLGGFLLWHGDHNEGTGVWWGGHSGIGRGAETRDLLGSIYGEKGGGGGQPWDSSGTRAAK